MTFFEFHSLPIQFLNKKLKKKKQQKIIHSVLRNIFLLPINGTLSSSFRFTSSDKRQHFYIPGWLANLL